MKPTLVKGLAIASVLAVTGVAGPSLAQQPPGPPPSGARAGWDHQRPDPAAMADRRAQRLRDILQLRPNQEPALAALTDAMKPPEGAREKMRAERDAMKGLTTPERLDRMRDRMSQRQAAFDRRAMAIKRFYAQLSPTQQKAFDAMGPMRGGGMGGHRGGEGGKGGRHGMHGGPGGGGPDGGE
jgi:protein CpxP